MRQAGAVFGGLKVRRRAGQLQASFRGEDTRLVTFLCDISPRDKQHLTPPELGGEGKWEHRNRGGYSVPPTRDETHLPRQAVSDTEPMCCYCRLLCSRLCWVLCGQSQPRHLSGPSRGVPRAAYPCLVMGTLTVDGAPAFQVVQVLQLSVICSPRPASVCSFRH